MHLKALNGLNIMSFFFTIKALRGNKAVFDKPSLMHLTV